MTITADFVAGRSLIPTIIKRQTGSVDRALLEPIMNSMDFSASEIRVGWESHPESHYMRLWIQDDGLGLPDDREAVIRIFTRLGTDDEDEELPRKRLFGEFHMGRVQLLSYGPVSWTSGRFRIECDIRKSLQLQIHELEQSHPGMLVDVRFPLGEELTENGLLSSFRSVRRHVELVTAAKLYFQDELLEPKPVVWHRTTPEYQIHISPESEIEGWRLYLHGIYVTTLYGSQYEDPVTINFTSRVQTNISRNEIMADDPVRQRAEAETLGLLNRRMLGIKPVHSQASLRAAWRKLAEVDPTPAIARKLKCIRVTHSDQLLTLREAHNRSYGVLLPTEYKNFYADFIARTGTALPVDLKYVPGESNRQKLDFINTVASKVNLQFSLFNPTTILPFYNPIGEQLDRVLRETKPTKRQVAALRVIESELVTSLQLIWPELQASLGHIRVPLPVLALVDYAGPMPPVFTDRDKVIYVSLSEFTRLDFKKPKTCLPMLDQLIRAVAEIVGERQAERMESISVEEASAKFLLAAYAPLLARLLTELL